MPVVRPNKIDFDDCHVYPNHLIALSRLEILSNRPLQEIVAICKRQVQSDSWGSSPRFEYLSVQARPSVGWALCISKEQDGSEPWRQPLTLKEALAALGKLIGQSPPSIAVVEYGVGIYTAQNPKEVHNPWQFVDGGTYRARNEKGVEVGFVAKLDRGGVRVQPIGHASGGQRFGNDWFDPNAVLTSSHWKNMDQYDPASKCWQPLFDIEKWESKLCESLGVLPSNSEANNGIHRNEDALWALGLFSQSTARGATN